MNEHLEWLAHEPDEVPRSPHADADYVIRLRRERGEEEAASAAEAAKAAADKLAKEEQAFEAGVTWAKSATWAELTSVTGTSRLANIERLGLETLAAALAPPEKIDYLAFAEGMLSLIRGLSPVFIGGSCSPILMPFLALLAQMTPAVS